MVVRQAEVIGSPRDTATLVAMTLTVRGRFVVTHHTPIAPRRTSARPRAITAGRRRDFVGCRTAAVRAGVCSAGSEASFVRLLLRSVVVVIWRSVLHRGRMGCRCRSNPASVSYTADATGDLLL